MEYITGSGTERSVDEWIFLDVRSNEVDRRPLLPGISWRGDWPTKAATARVDLGQGFVSIDRVCAVVPENVVPLAQVLSQEM